MAGTPKVCFANDVRPRAKFSLWPFCKWILAPTRAILATDANGHHILPVAPGGSTLLKAYKIGNGPDSILLLCSDYREFISGTNKETVDSPNLL